MIKEKSFIEKIDKGTKIKKIEIEDDQIWRIFKSFKFKIINDFLLKRNIVIMLLVFFNLM